VPFLNRSEEEKIKEEREKRREDGRRREERKGEKIRGLKKSCAEGSLDFCQSPQACHAPGEGFVASSTRISCDG